MADRRRWLSMESQSKFNKAIDLFLLEEWPELQSALNVFRDIKKENFSAHVFDFFASTSVEGLNSVIEIPRESLLGFKQILDRVLSAWPDFQTAANMLGAHRRHDLASAIFFFLAKTAEPNEDSLAEEMHRIIRDTLDGRVDFSNCKNAAQQLLNIHESCLQEDLKTRKDLKRGRSLKRREITSSA
ncbi:hypothetical protein TIFTF001_001182 [Ficus carica]|uniref:Uncharacterized protein n=1 Tax=Ficus carica TaxID=3494 RepID=A0AA87ZKX3_FICCA|nr:hypothetical protein TIFTF001_001182 [Ficus carica]